MGYKEVGGGGMILRVTSAPMPGNLIQDSIELSTDFDKLLLSEKCFIGHNPHL